MTYSKSLVKYDVRFLYKEICLNGKVDMTYERDDTVDTPTIWMLVFVTVNCIYIVFKK